MSEVRVDSFMFPVGPVRPVPPVADDAFCVLELELDPDGPVPPVDPVDILYLFIDTIIHEQSHTVVVRHKVCSVCLNMCIVKSIPRLTRWKVATPGEPVIACEAHNRKECEANFVEDDDGCVLSSGSHGGLVKHHDLRKLSKHHLLVASLLLALFTGPIGNALWLDGLGNRIGDGLLASYRRNRELVESVRTNVLVGTVVALNGVRNLEARKLIKEGYFITEELNELVGVADAFACGHRGTDLDAFIQGFQSFIATAGPDFG